MPGKRFLAALLCAGYGTRMGDLTRSTPKPLLPVAGRPLLDYLLDQIAGMRGLTAVHVVTNARDFPRFERWAGSWRERLGARGRTLQLHDDGSTANENRRGAVGDLAFLFSEIEIPDGALVAGTDNLYRLQLASMWNAFLAGEDNLLLALREDDPRALRRSGVLELDPDDRVVAVHEKPEEPPSSWACPALYCLRAAAIRRLFPYLQAGHAADDLGLWVNHVLSLEPVRAFRAKGSRLHVGSPEMLRLAEETLLRDGPGGC